jgi:hypothetical protein
MKTWSKTLEEGYFMVILLNLSYATTCRKRLFK